MKLRTLLLAAALAAAPLASGEDSFQGALQRTSTPHASLYSFADLYRLTVSGTGAPSFPLAPAIEAPIRTAIAQPAPQFAISDVREPHLGLLLASGVALALWVARRRLGYAF
jgi:hypothetical protein